MKQIFGNGQMNPQKLNREKYNYNSQSKKPPKAMVVSPKKKQLEPIKQFSPPKNPYQAVPEDDLEKAIFDLQDVKNTYMNETKEFE